MTPPKDYRQPIRVKPDTRRRLMKESGRRTAESGDKWSIDKLINDLLDVQGIPAEKPQEAPNNG